MEPPRYPCPVCGAYSLTQPGHASVLLAVCDVLVTKTLESMGKYIVRAERSRFRQLGTRPWHTAHTLFLATDTMVEKATRGAWDVVPALFESYGCCDVTPVQVVNVLSAYVHDLAITGTEHNVDELRYRLVQIGLPVYLHEPALY